jgi:ribonuclease HI
MQSYIYTDGGCRPNPGKGAWAIAVVEGERVVFDQTGFEPETTNNRMELSAMLAALAYAQRFPDRHFTVVTDSQYTKQGLLVWIHGWIRREWRGSTGKAVVNQDLWEALHRVHGSLSNVTLAWTKGHAQNPWNNHVDELCTRTIQGAGDFLTV